MVHPLVAALRWPRDVAEQWLWEHGHNAHFLLDYRTVQLDNITWSLEALPVGDLLAAPTGLSEGDLLDLNAADHAHRVRVRPAEIRQAWDETGTWLRAPSLSNEISLHRPPMASKSSKAALGSEYCAAVSATDSLSPTITMRGSVDVLATTTRTSRTLSPPARPTGPNSTPSTWLPSWIATVREPVGRQSLYGLNAVLFTENLSRAHRMAARLKAGTIWANCFFIRDLRAPFGGVGDSGIGREGGTFSREFFTVPKTVVMHIAADHT